MFALKFVEVLFVELPLHLAAAMPETKQANMRASLMDSDTFSGIVWGAALVGIFTSIYVGRRCRWHRTKRLLVMELLKRYFQGDMPADQLGTREITHHHFIQNAEFHSLAIAAFQRAVDANFAHESHSKEDERKLLRLLAALKNEFGLTDLYQIEGWRAGRE